tara:strand:+ start:32 stop:235 length:204 start_codon:yes stop_codon:yes gene_type:complete
LYKEDIILKAALEISPEYLYDFERGTLGPTLYIRAPDKKTARIIRESVPMTFEGYPIIVTYSESQKL